MNWLALQVALRDSLVLMPWEHWKRNALIRCTLNYVSGNCKNVRKMIRSCWQEWVNDDHYQGLNVSQRCIMMILPIPGKHTLMAYAATRHGFWLRELLICPKMGKSMTALVVLCPTQSNLLRHCTVELCALTTGTAVSRWATAMIDNNLDGMMDVKHKRWEWLVLSRGPRESSGLMRKRC